MSNPCYDCSDHVAALVERWCTLEDPLDKVAVCLRCVSGEEAIWDTRELPLFSLLLLLLKLFNELVSVLWAAVVIVIKSDGTINRCKSGGMCDNYEDEEAFWATRDEDTEGALGGVT